MTKLIVSPKCICVSRWWFDTKSVNESEQLVSIVICTFNRKKLLSACLNSIFSMDYPRASYEVIVVDKGSTDGTQEIYQSFPGIKLVTNMKFGVPTKEIKEQNLPVVL